MECVLVSRLHNNDTKNHTYQRLRHRTRILRWRDTLCSSLTHYYIVTSRLLFGKALPLSVFKHVKASYGQDSNVSLSQYLHFSSHLRIEPLVSRLVVLCFVRISLQRKNSIELLDRVLFFETHKQTRGRIPCKFTV